MSCNLGKFCSEIGLFCVSGDCDVGYFCEGNVSKSNLEDGVMGNICFVGSFCVKGSIKL